MLCLIIYSSDQRKLPCPKRTAELSPLKYDSEEDANNELNLSFREDEDSDNQTQQPFIQQSFVVAANSSKPSSDDKENLCIENVQLHLEKMSLDSPIQTIQSSLPVVAKQTCDPTSVQHQFRQILPSKNAFAKQKPNEKKIISIFKNINTLEEPPSPLPSTADTLLSIPNIKSDEVVLKNFEDHRSRLPPSNSSITIPAGKTAEIVSSVIDDGLETPIRQQSHNFVTPSIESSAVCWRLPSARVPLSSRTQTKTKSEMLNEFQSKKILFTTPKTGHRPAIIPSRKNESFDLSSDDSVDKPTALMASVGHARLSVEKLFDVSDCAEEVPDIRKVLVINGNQFMINKKIGSGGSSAVFLCEAKHSRKEYAIKVSLNKMIKRKHLLYRVVRFTSNKILE